MDIKPETMLTIAAVGALAYTCINKKKEVVKDIVRRLKDDYPESKCSKIFWAWDLVNNLPLKNPVFFKL